MEKERVYFVIDMKSFFASVECSERGLDAMQTKLVVADAERGDKTICLAVSPSMKALGVKNRCRMYEIPKNIEFITAKPRMKKYIEYASEIYGIYLKYIDKSDIHVYSIDECFIDVTDYLKLYKLRAKSFAIKLMTEIKEKLGIPSSCGIGSNMYLAKIALDITAKHAKDRVGWLTEEKFKKELWSHLPLMDFWGISSGTVARLKKHGIYDMEGIAKANEDILYREFGINAELLIDHAWGRETCEMRDIKNYKTKSKSISSSQILPSNYTCEEGRLILREMVQNGCYDLFRRGYVTNLIGLYVGYGDDRGSVAKGTQRLIATTNLNSFIYPAFDSLYSKVVDVNRPIRKIGYEFSGLLPNEYETYDLFVDLNKVKKEKKVVEGVLKIHDTFGKNALLKGIDYNEKATQIERNKMIGGHNGGEE